MVYACVTHSSGSAVRDLPVSDNGSNFGVRQNGGPPHTQLGDVQSLVLGIISCSKLSVVSSYYPGKLNRQTSALIHTAVF